jgi:hypothetical protein
MYFHIDTDERHRIVGWLAPDDPSRPARIIVKVQDQEEFELEADIMRPEIRDLGIHATGIVGFEITSLIVPDLEQMEDVELLEADGRLPIYRRAPPGRYINRKLFLFDCSVMPQRRIVNSAIRQFALSYSCIEHYPPESVNVLINNKSCGSLFFTGRPNFTRYSQLLRGAGYVVAAMLRDPYVEMAEKLLVLKLLARPNTGHLLNTFVTGVEPLIDFARDIKLDDPKGVLAGFRGLNEPQRLALASPMVRTFGCTADEPPDWRHVNLALENLASMDVVGTETSFSLFKNLLNEALGAEFLGDEECEKFDNVEKLASMLSRVGLAADLLEHDLALYSAAQESIASAVDEDPGEPAGSDA